LQSPMIHHDHLHSHHEFHLGHPDHLKIVELLDVEQSITKIFTIAKHSFPPSFFDICE
jgi:hypothetical protein